MVQLNFDIEKIFRRGVWVLTLGFILSGAVVGVFLFRSKEWTLEKEVKREIKENPSFCTIPLEMKGEEISIPLPNLLSEFSFYFAPSRPGGSFSRDLFFLRLKKGGAVRLVSLPERVYFRYAKGLQFAEQAGPFWIAFSKQGDGFVSASVFLINSLGQEEERGSFMLRIEESPQRVAGEFPEGSPFRILGEGRWIGQDLFLKKYGAKESLFRLELGSLGKEEVFSLQPGDFLVWKENRWISTSFPETEEGPLAQFVISDDKMALFQGWVQDEYVRFSLLFTSPPSLKPKGEDFLSAVRVRSEKQISCMLDRQCFVLRLGDWVLKTENRWKVLRKTEEKEAYTQGKLAGELFVFDRIDVKGGQKVICGSLFNPIRSQFVSIEIAAHTQSLEAVRLGKGKNR